MELWRKTLGATAGLFGAIGVGLAAAGAHLTDKPVVTTAAYFLLFHAVALLALCAIAHRRPTRLLLGAGTAIAVGTILFSGDLAVRGLANVILVHRAAPTGGMVLIVAWLAVAAALPSALSTD